MRAIAAAMILLLTATPALAAGRLNLDGKLPNGGRPAQHVHFPAIRDWSSLRIRLARNACMGTCPIYTVEIDGDGTVTWTGINFVKTIGPRTSKIAPAQVKALFDAFRKAEFFWLLDSYNGLITDGPSTDVSIAFDDHGKAVHDYIGSMVGMPVDVAKLERRIDDLANSADLIGTPDERVQQGRR